MDQMYKMEWNGKGKEWNTGNRIRQKMEFERNKKQNGIELNGIKINVTKSNIMECTRKLE